MTDEPIGVSEGSRRGRRPQEKAARLVQSATGVFAEKGYARAQITEICRAAGVSVGTFYDNFENKAELLLHIAEAFYEISGPAPTRSLEELESQMLAMLNSPRPGVSRAWLEAVRVEPSLMAAHERMRIWNLERYRVWVRGARAAQDVEPLLDDAETARAVVALIKDAIGNTVDPVETRARLLARATWALIMSEGPASSKANSASTRGSAADQGRAVVDHGGQ